MNNFTILQEAIKNKNVVEFDYKDKDGKLLKRVFHPYVLYYFKAKNGEDLPRLGGVQIDGESSSTTEFPDFKDFLPLDNIFNLTVKDDLPSFGPELDEKYNPESDRYKYCVEKV